MNARHAVKRSKRRCLTPVLIYMLAHTITKYIYYILIRSTKEFHIKKLWIHPRGSEMCLACIYRLWHRGGETLCAY